MRKRVLPISILLFSLLLPFGIISPTEAQETSDSPVEPICNANRNATWTVGLIYCDNRVNEDYTLFAPMTSESTYLIDAFGRMVHSWTSPSGLPPGMAVYMLEDGDLLRTTNLGTDFDPDGNGVAGKIERLSWDSQMEWEWYFPGDTKRSHHDIEPLSNGNFLMIAWEFKNESEFLQAGRDPNKMTHHTKHSSELWPDHIVEVQPLGTDQANIVWEWHIWDHLIQDYDSTKDNYGVVADHPELIDINFADAPGPDKYKTDWMHCNGIDYNPILDQIALSCRNMNEIYIIDHSTTTEEASGHTGGNSEKGGDILYRWGNPEAYRAGTADDQKLFGQHDIQWINEGRLGAGDLIVFNNGVGRSTNYSSADVISPPLVNGEYVLQSGSSWAPAAPSWSWNQGTSIFATSLGGVERLENGNTLVTWGVRGTFIEVNPEGEVVWKYINPVIGTGPLNQGDDIPQGQNAQGQNANWDENKVFKTHRYNSSFSGFAGKDLTPDDYVESWTDYCSNEESIPWDSDGDGCIDDSDGDGVKDNADLCSGFDDNVDIDGDSIPDDCDSLIDSDADGVGDNADEFPEDASEQYDSDGDGVGDNTDAFPWDPSESADTDGDGYGDNTDAFPEDGTEWVDTDGDGTGDNADTDADGDGIDDDAEDSDGDGVYDDQDAFPFDANETADSDGDGVGDNGDAFPNDANETTDTDGDGIGDNSDDDADGDGQPNDLDDFPLNSEESTDTDGDGVGDNEEGLPGIGIAPLIVALAAAAMVITSRRELE